MLTEKEIIEVLKNLKALDDIIISGGEIKSWVSQINTEQYNNIKQFLYPEDTKEQWITPAMQCLENMITIEIINLANRGETTIISTIFEEELTLSEVRFIMFEMRNEYSFVKKYLKIRKEIFENLIEYIKINNISIDIQMSEIEENVQNMKNELFDSFKRESIYRTITSLNDEGFIKQSNRLITYFQEIEESIQIMCDYGFTISEEQIKDTQFEIIFNKMRKLKYNLLKILED